MRAILFTFFLTLSQIISASTYYVAKSGNDRNAGTITQPWGTWQKAFETAMAGDTVYFRGGVWYPTDFAVGNSVTFIATRQVDGVYTGGLYGHNGTAEDPICFFNYPGENPILDCSLINLNGHNFNTGIGITFAEYLHFKGLTVRNVAQPANGNIACGIGADFCSNMIFENMTVYNIGGRGYTYWGVNGYYGITTDTVRYINCDVHNCFDALSEDPGNGADGWKCNNEPGGYMYFEGCRAWKCSDDGFDPSGSGVVVFNNCWSFANGFPGVLDGNGFKSGGVLNNLPYPTRIYLNNLSAFNYRDGYYDLEFADLYRNNSRFYNNISYQNGIGIAISDNALRPNSLSIFRNNIIYKTVDKDAAGRPYHLDAFCYYTESHNTWDYAVVGSIPRWIPTDTVTVTDADFVSVDSTGLSGVRQTDGSLPVLNFLKLAKGSDLIDAGTQIPTSDGVDFLLKFNGSAPDIGAFEYEEKDPDFKRVTSIVVTGTGGVSSITSDNGQLQLIATILPADATNKSVTWSISSGTDKASISSTGLVTAINNGVAIAKVSALDGSGIFGSFQITITNQVIPVAGISVTGTGGVSAISTDDGTLQLIATVMPANATNKTVLWSISAGTDKASISSTGLVSALSNGTVVARATANDGTGVYGTLTILISNQVIPVTGITISGVGGASAIDVDNGTLQLNASIIPSNATNKNVTWSIASGTDKASISSTGLVTAIDNGTAVARATSNDGSGVYGTLTISITNQVILVTGISVTGLGGATLITIIGGTLQLNASILPTNATNKSVTWSITSGMDKASISSSGLLTAIDNGTAVARATSKDGSGIYGTLTITISNQVIPVAGITVAGGASAITVDNGTLQLSASVLPANATNKTVTWSIVSGMDNASVNSTGLVTAILNGTAMARATANDGSGVYGTLTIMISNQVIPVTGITITGAGGASAINVDNGTLQLSASVIPANATNKNVTWSITSGTDKASISSTGIVTAIDNGTVVARATANDGSGIYGSFVVTVSNQLIASLNTPPVVKIDFKSNNYSGFIGEIDASRSYDSDGDNLIFSWITPNNIPVSSTTSSVLKFLGPLVKSKQTYQFVLSVSDGKASTSKTIVVEINPYKPELEVAEVKDIKASGFESTYFPYNVIDGNIGTMWSAYGDNHWLMIELKYAFNIDHVEIAFHSGQNKESYFDILGSSDNILWEPVLDKISSCDFSHDLQVFEFPPSKTTREYNYVRLVGHGNLTDAWNFISELKVLGYRYRNSPLYENLPVKIYPNPAKEYITIRLDDESFLPEYYQITNLVGTVIISGEIGPGIKQFTTPINLANGIYLIQFCSDNVTLFTQKFVVSR